MFWCPVPHVKVTAVGSLIRPREVSPAQQCRAVHGWAGLGWAWGELDARSGAAAAIVAVVAAAGEAESPGKWTEVMQRGSEEPRSQHTARDIATSRKRRSGEDQCGTQGEDVEDQDQG